MTTTTDHDATTTNDPADHAAPLEAAVPHRRREMRSRGVVDSRDRVGRVGGAEASDSGKAVWKLAGRGFVKLVKCRTGSEAHIAYLKHSWGSERTLTDGAQTWAGWGVLAHNSNKRHDREAHPGAMKCWR
jgi:hypothetical protein